MGGKSTQVASPHHAEKTVVALDVGGTDIKAGLVCGRELLVEKKFSTCAADGPRAAEAAVVAAAIEMTTLTGFPRPRAVGLVVPGIVDSERGLSVYAENLGWDQLPIAQIVADATGLPVGFGHDVRAAGMAERAWGAATGKDDFIFIPIGTGIAAAVVLGGQEFAGGGLSGEVGHGGRIEGLECVCGARGCVETVASAAAIGRLYRQATGLSIAEVPGARQVLERANSGDTVAAEIWEDALDRLSEVIVEFVQVLATPLVVIGGGLSRAGDQLLVPLRQRVRDRLSYHRLPQIVPAELGSSAGMWGAALLANRSAHINPHSRNS